jgi:cytochrome P450
VSADYAFFLFMALFPDAQAKAQAEIDAVIGRDRLPTLADQNQLPYVHALVSEVLRFCLISPVAPRVCRTDDVYQGYLLPKGSIVIPNIWCVSNLPKNAMSSGSPSFRAMSRDSRTYKNPHEFDPTRFLGDHPEQDPREFIFGFGRRICPGRLYANNSMFLLMAISLATLKVSKAIGTDGKEITPQIDFEGGVVV